MGNKGFFVTLFFSLAVVWLLAGCERSTTLPTPSIQITNTSIPSSPTSLPSQIQTLQVTATLLPSTPIPPTAAISAFVWKIEASRIENWPEYVYGLSWKSNNQFYGDSIDGRVKGETDGNDASLEVGSQKNHFSISPSGFYTTTCASSKFQIYQANQLQSFIETSILPDGCDLISWSPDEQALAFMDNGGLIYLWELTEATPRKIGQTKVTGTNINWSPDATKLTVLDDAGGYRTYKVLFRDGSLANETFVKVSDQSEFPPNWINNTIVENSSDCNAEFFCFVYYEALSGDILASDIVVKHLDNQFPQTSPDGKWIFIDQRESMQPYLLFNFQTREQYVLANSTEFDLRFVIWDVAGQSFYAIKREIATPKTVIPDSALVRFHLNSRRWEPIVHNAIYAAPSKTASYFFVVRRQMSVDYEPLITASIFNSSGQSSLTPISISAEARQAADFSNYRVWWSNDEQQVVYYDLEGHLNLLQAIGGIQTLASSRNLDFNLNSIDLLWSPNDQHFLFVANGEGAWLVTP